MKIITGIITAPGRVHPTIDNTVESMERAGFEKPIVYTDHEQSGCWVTWIRAMADLITKEADAIMICEDDVNFSIGLQEYLKISLWPEDPTKIALCSPFCPQLYKTRRTGWHPENRGWDLCMAQSWIIPKSSAERIYDNFKNVPQQTEKIPRITQENIKKHHKAIQHRLLTDSRIGEWALQNNMNVWYHTPSLAQHTAVDNSLIGNNFGMYSLREASDFDQDSSNKQIILRVIAGIID